VGSQSWGGSNILSYSKLWDMSLPYVRFFLLYQTVFANDFPASIFSILITYDLTLLKVMCSVFTALQLEAIIDN
jgi:hypothetical protein